MMCFDIAREMNIDLDVILKTWHIRLVLVTWGIIRNQHYSEMLENWKRQDGDKRGRKPQQPVHFISVEQYLSMR